MTISAESDAPIGGVSFDFIIDSSLSQSDFHISKGPLLDRMDLRFGIIKDTLKIVIAPARDSAKCRDCYQKPGKYKLTDIKYSGEMPGIVTVRASDIYGRLMKTSLLSRKYRK